MAAEAVTAEAVTAEAATPSSAPAPASASTAKSSTTNGTQLDIWGCNGGANQKFSYTSSGTILGSQSGKCVTVQSAGTVNGAMLILYTYNGGSNQKWTRKERDSTKYRGPPSTPTAAPGHPPTMS